MTGWLTSFDYLYIGPTFQYKIVPIKIRFKK